MSIDKIFFIEMMTNGIPVVPDIDVTRVLKLIESESNDYKLDYDIVILDDQLGVLDKDKSICATLKLVERNKNDYRLTFFVDNNYKALDSAKTIGSIMMLAISSCAQLNYFNLSILPSLKNVAIAPSGEEESETFDSDFI